ncbi:MAG: BLUF domain-containing protein [Brevundimonas sp.]|uniref:BLUF domain-containing protein n=1 Tax=Brevundimonas sp. TaxID=1871086 RepID=UPI00391A7828
MGWGVLERLVYVSTASSRQDVTGQAAKIAEEAKSYNQDNGISGALVGHEGHFIHALEGEPSVLDRLLKRLEDDPRHYDLVLVDRWPVDDRLFDGWAMAGVAMDSGTRADLEALIADPTLSPRPLVESMRSRAVPHA